MRYLFHPFSAYPSNYLSNHLSNYLSIVTISNISRHIGYCLVLNEAGFIIEKSTSIRPEISHICVNFVIRILEKTQIQIPIPSHSGPPKKRSKQKKGPTILQPGIFTHIINDQTLLFRSPRCAEPNRLITLALELNPKLLWRHWWQDVATLIGWLDHLPSHEVESKHSSGSQNWRAVFVGSEKDIGHQQKTPGSWIWINKTALNIKWTNNSKFNTKTLMAGYFTKCLPGFKPILVWSYSTNVF